MSDLVKTQTDQRPGSAEASAIGLSVAERACDDHGQ